MDKCIRACKNCEKEMGKEHPCSVCCYDCYSICDFTLKININDKFLDIGLLDLCINACNLCITECAKHMDKHKVCAECVNACFLCISECNQFKLNVFKNINEDKNITNELF
jgi:hypothetical protein